MFHSQSGRPRDEVARSFMSKISAATGGDLAHCNIFLNFVCINTLSRNH